MAKEEKPDFIQSAFAKWRWFKWKVFLVWAVLILIALVFVILPLLWPTPPVQ